MLSLAKVAKYRVGKGSASVGAVLIPCRPALARPSGLAHDCVAACCLVFEFGFLCAPPVSLKPFPTPTPA